MAKLFLAAAALLATSANAFAPGALPPASVSNHASSMALGMAAEEPGSKRKRALKTLAKTAGVLSSAALATAGFPPAALAAKKAKQVVEVVETVDNTKKIVAAGAALLAGGAAFAKLSAGGGLSENFLEASPYWDQSDVPVNVYKNKAPFTGKVVSTKRIVGPQATGETCHIIIDHQGKFPYWEGQSWGVIPPGTREKDGKPHSVRLYSIASSRYGDDKTGNTGSLCVRRATYWCPELKAEDPAKKGVCSNFLCDTKPGDEVMMTGPAGKVMLMPEEDPKTDYIMVATGTGIAPFRGFVRRLFFENTPAAKAYKGQAWLFLGVANSDALLYDDEFQEAKKNFPDNFRLDYALSREQNNKKGGKMYIQDKVEEYADEIFTKLNNGAHIYFCGLKGMMPGIQDMLAEVCKAKGLDYDEFIKGLKEKKQWHVEVY
jgi:ferredoxin--NADP+ reductase